jgi:hypothetical protein
MEVDNSSDDDFIGFGWGEMAKIVGHTKSFKLQIYQRSIPNWKF